MRLRAFYRLPALVLLTVIISLAGAFRLSAIDFEFGSDLGQSLVRVTTSNMLMSMEHSTSDIEGKMTVSLEDVRGSASMQFTVYTASLSSRMDLWKVRDKLMRSDYLETARYPTAGFTLTSVNRISSNALISFEPSEIEATGDFTLHGVTKSVKVKATIIYMKESPATQARGAGDLLNIVAEWTFNLSSYNIKIPHKGPVIFDDEQKMLLRVMGSTVQ